jgi:CrcB protein
MPSEAPTVTETAEPSRVGPRRTRLSAGVLAAIGTGGMLGAIGRYGIGQRWPSSPGEFPWSTLVINVSGAFLLGVVVTLVMERWPPTRFVRPFVGIGMCGGYTTWSTFMTEAALLVRNQRVSLAVGYLAASVGAGLVATYAGIGLARLWPTEATRRSREVGRTG